MSDFYKDITREQLISSLEQYQNNDVAISNELYRYKKNINETLSWLANEAKKAQRSANVQENEFIKGEFIGLNMAFERTTRQLEDFIEAERLINIASTK